MGFMANSRTTSETPRGGFDEDFDLSQLNTRQLTELSQAVAQEFTERAIAAGDMVALAELAFESGWDNKGVPRDPWVRDGVLYCAGGKQHSSKTAHRCRFATVEGEWVWQLSDTLYDEVRYSDALGSSRGITLLAAVEGLKLSMVSSVARSGRHERVGLAHFEVRDGKLVTAALPPRTTD
jgi:hypothetical protein